MAIENTARCGHPEPADELKRKVLAGSCARNPALYSVELVSAIRDDETRHKQLPGHSMSLGARSSMPNCIVEELGPLKVTRFPVYICISPRSNGLCANNIAAAWAQQVSPNSSTALHAKTAIAQGTRRDPKTGSSWGGLVAGRPPVKEDGKWERQTLRRLCYAYSLD